jgi:signal transduction histidine kinase
MALKVGGKPFRSLTTTLTLTFFVFTVVLLVFVGVFSVYSLLIAQRNSLNERQVSIAKDAGVTVENFIDEKIGILEKVSRLFDVVGMKPAEQKDMLGKLMGSESAFRQLVVLNNQGEELMSVARQSKMTSGNLKDRAGDTMFSVVEERGSFISSVYISEVTSEPLVTIAVPAKSALGDFKGILMAEVNLKFMWDLVNEIDVGEKGTVYVVDRDGRLIAFEDTSLVLRGENLSHLEEVKEFMNGGHETKIDFFNIAEGINKNQVVTNHVYLAEPDWAVVVELPIVEAYGPLARGTLLVVGVMLLILGIAISIVVYLSRKITKPIIGLRDAAFEIGSGNLEKHIDIETGDEIGQLAETFNLMTNKLKDQKEREIAVSKMKSEFVSIVAHQLHTPLSGLKWTLDMIEDGSLGKFTKKQKEHFVNCGKANDKMIDTINDLLNLTRIEEGKFLYKYSTAKIGDLIQETIDSLGLEIKRKELSMVFQKPDDVPTLSVDSEKISIAIKNLLENAIKYSNNGGRIEISLVVNLKDVVVSIKDVGIGIPKEQQNRMFEKFFRGSNAAEKETNGSGLGLYISNNIIKKHGGNMWFESEEGKGSTFYFNLPVGQ